MRGWSVLAVVAVLMTPWASKADVVYAFASYASYIVGDHDTVPFGAAAIIGADVKDSLLPLSLPTTSCYISSARCNGLAVIKNGINNDFLLNPTVSSKSGFTADYDYNVSETNYSHSDYGTTSGSGWHTLTSTDVVYTYTDNTGKFVSFIHNGYLTYDKNNDTFQFANLACAYNFDACYSSGISFSASNARLTFQDSANAKVGISLALPQVDLQYNGIYTFQSGGVSATLSVYSLPASGPVGVSTSGGDQSGPTDVPEPASLALLGMGMVGVAAARRRRRAG